PALRVHINAPAGVPENVSAAAPFRRRRPALSSGQHTHRSLKVAPMPHIKFGPTGLRVSRLCLGTMTFGLQCDEAQGHAIMDTAAAGGIEFLDTADVYPLGGNTSTVG